MRLSFVGYHEGIIKMRGVWELTIIVIEVTESGLRFQMNFPERHFHPGRHRRWDSVGKVFWPCRLQAFRLDWLARLLDFKTHDGLSRSRGLIPFW